MKKLLKTSFLLLALLSVVFVSCKKDYPEPPIQVLPIGTVYTIEDILAMEPGTVFTEDASVYGIITADEQSGNLYKAAFMQDRASGKAIELYLNAVSGVRIGDSIRVYLKDVTYAMYNNLPQLSNFEADGHIIILANNKDIEPAKATIAEINQGKYLAGLVRLENVMFTEQNTFADPTTYGNRTLIDALDPSNNVIVRTSNYANFANDSLPQGAGNLTAIASVYNNTWQLYIRSAYELDFEGYNPDQSNLPYFQDFSNSFGTYTTYSVLGDQEWIIDYNTAKMTGHVGNGNFANEDWLLSAPVSLTDVDHVKVCVNYAAMYQNSNTEDVTLQISKDYKTGSNPLDANWIQMPVTYPNTSSWSDFKTVETSLDEFLGETVTVAIKFTCTESQSRTMEVKYILVQEGQPGDGPTPPGPGGDGELQSMPYTQSFDSEFGTYITKDVLGPQSWVIDFQTAKMTGYAGSSHANEDWLISSPVAVTGVSEAKVSVYYSAQYQNSNARDVTLHVSTDYVYGNDPSTATWTEMSATYPNTTSFKDFQTVETSLNEFLGQNVTVAIKYTSTDSQSRTIEIKSITVQEGHAEGGGNTPPTPPTPGGELQNMPYAQSFESEFGTYIPKDVLGAQSWEIDYSTAKITGHVGGNPGENFANEDWLISSPVAITGVSEAKMTMVYIGRYFNDINSEVTIWASTNYVWNSEPTTATWTQVPATLREGSNWNDFITTEISLNQFIGQTVTFAVKYLSTDSKAGTMEIKSITVQEGHADGGETPPTPPDPGEGEGSGTANDPYNVAAGIALQSEEPIAWVQGYIVGAVKSGLSSVGGNSDVNWSAPFDLATNVVIADNANCHEISQCIIVNLPAGKPLRAQVNLMDNPGNLGKRLAVNGKLRKYFGQAGLRDSGGTEADFVLEGGDTPTPPPGETIFSETFANGQGDFAIMNVNLPEALSYVWNHDSQYACMKASAYVSGQNYAAESWLVSPAIDLSGVSTATLKFDQAVNYASPDALSIWVSTNYNGNVNTATWTQLSVSAWPAGNNWTFISSTADLTSFAGQTVNIAFKYTSTNSASATWEVKNIVVE